MRWIPSGVFNLTNLKSLWLSNNNLCYLPPQFSQLRCLQVLGLNYNQITELCPEILELIRLQYLDVSNNQLLEIPKEIYKLSNLQYLILNDNELVQIPLQIGNLTRLVEIQVADNLLEKLPVTLGNLDRLQSQSHSGCAFNGNPSHYPPNEVIVHGSHFVIKFLQNEWAQIPMQIQQQLLAGGLNNPKRFKFCVEYKDRCCEIDCEAFTLAELKAAVWKYLNIHCRCEAGKLHCYDPLEDSWREVFSLEDLQAVVKLRVVRLGGNTSCLQSDDSELEDLVAVFNAPTFSFDWKSLACRLGFHDNSLLSAWEQTSNPAKCVVYAWLSQEEGRVEALKQILEQYSLPDFASYGRLTDSSF